MQLTHIAIWTNELERSRDFYVKYFGGKSNEKYVNPKKGFASYFVTFEGAASLEIMQRTDITVENDGVYIGLAHFAFLPDQKREWIKRLNNSAGMVTRSWVSLVLPETVFMKVL